MKIGVSSLVLLVGISSSTHAWYRLPVPAPCLEAAPAANEQGKTCLHLLDTTSTQFFSCGLRAAASSHSPESAQGFERWTRFLGAEQGHLTQETTSQRADAEGQTQEPWPWLLLAVPLTFDWDGALLDPARPTEALNSGGRRSLWEQERRARKVRAYFSRLRQRWADVDKLHIFGWVPVRGSVDVEGAIHRPGGAFAQDEPVQSNRFLWLVIPVTYDALGALHEEVPDSLQRTSFRPPYREFAPDLPLTFRWEVVQVFFDVSQPPSQWITQQEVQANVDAERLRNPFSKFR